MTEMKTLQAMAEARSDMGREKYQVPNPTEPNENIELFWLRNLVRDIHEELADGAVYMDRLKTRLEATSVVELPEWVQEHLDVHIHEYGQALEVAYMEASFIELWLSKYVPDLVTDHEEHWGPFKHRV